MADCSIVGLVHSACLKRTIGARDACETAKLAKVRDFACAKCDARICEELDVRRATFGHFQARLYFGQGKNQELYHS
jgi:hypothetical protein